MKRSEERRDGRRMMMWQRPLECNVRALVLATVFAALIRKEQEGGPGMGRGMYQVCVADHQAA